MTPKYRVKFVEHEPLRIERIKQGKAKMTQEFRIWAIMVIIVALAISFFVGYLQDMELAAMRNQYNMQLKMGEEK